MTFVTVTILLKNLLIDCKKILYFCLNLNNKEIFNSERYYTDIQIKTYARFLLRRKYASL